MCLEVIVMGEAVLASSRWELIVQAADSPYPMLKRIRRKKE